MRTAIDNIFDIKHHSPSTVNSFIEYRHQWYIQKIKGIRFPGSHAMARGKAVEQGINHYLENDSPTIEECIAAGIKLWSEEIIALGDDFDIRQTLGPSIKAAIKHFSEKGYDDGNTKTQQEIRVTLPGCELPFKGYMDFLRPDILLDTKCVGRTPTWDKSNQCYKQKQGYTLQAAIYQKATGLNPVFIYIIPLKEGVKVIEAPFLQSELDWGLKLASKAAQAIEQIISNPLDGDLMQAFMFPNPDAIYGGESLNLTLSQFGL